MGRDNCALGDLRNCSGKGCDLRNCFYRTEPEDDVLVAARLRVQIYQKNACAKFKEHSLGKVCGKNTFTHAAFTAGYSDDVTIRIHCQVWSPVLSLIGIRQEI